jgi:hypothetical protein
VHLQVLSKLSVLLLDPDRITDAGLTLLKGLNNLRELDLQHTHVSDDGVKELQQGLPSLEIFH